MSACASCACSGVAVRPVPIAQTGSYAMARRSRLSSCRPSGSPRPGAGARPPSRPPRARARSRPRTRSRGARRRARARRAAAAVASVSSKYWRRSECADDRAVDAELAQHRRARPRPVNGPRPPSARSARRRRRASRRGCRRRPRATTYGGQTTTSTPSGSPSRSRSATQNVERLRAVLVHLPVAGDQHGRILRTRAGTARVLPAITSRPESRRRPGAPFPRAAPATRRRRSRSTRCDRPAPSSCTARTESPPPTTV